MAHNAYIRGSIGAWATGTQVSQAEFWQLDQYVYGAINGDAGGTWAPAAAITLGGTAGLVLGTGNPLTVGGILTAGAINASGTCNFTNDVNFTNGEVWMGASYIYSFIVRSTSEFRSPVTFKSNVTLDGTFNVTGPSTVTTTLAGNTLLGSTPGTTGKSTTLEGDLVSAHNGGRVALSCVDFGDTSPTSGYRYRYLFNGLSIHRTLDLTIPDPRPGTEFHVHNKDTTYNVTVYIGGVLFAMVGPGTNVLGLRGDSSWFAIPY